MEVYGDTTLNQYFEYVQENAEALDFQINGRRGIHKGISRAVYWIKFPISNITDARQDFILEIREANIHALQFFVVKNDTIEKSVLTGDYFPMEERPIYHHHFLFPFSLSAQEEGICYVMAEKRSQSLIFNLELWEKQFFFENENSRNLVHGIILGLMILYFGISLLLFLLFPEKLTAYYLMLVIFLLLVINTVDGFAFQFLWSKVPQFVYDYFRAFNSAYQLMFFAYFFYEFLKNNFSQHFFHKTLGYLNKILLVLLVLSSILLLSIEYFHPDFRSLAESKVMGKTLLLIQFIVHFISFIVIIILAVLNYLQKKNFENSVLCFVIFMYLTIVILVTLNIFGSLNSGPHFSNVLLFGFILEIALFSILLFSKFWILIQQKETLIFASSQQQLKIANTLLQSQKMERQKIGEELKTNLQFFISQSQQTLLQENKNTSSVPFQKIKELLIQSKEEIKRIHNNILPSVANGEGLLKSIQNLCGEINNSKALKVRCDFYNITSTFSEFQRINLYRILQELLNNVVKHADATQAKVVMEQAENQIKMIVEDNGKGLGIHEAGLLENGFNSIKNRTQSMNGKLNFSKSKLGGLRVVIEIPV